DRAQHRTLATPRRTDERGDALVGNWQVHVLDGDLVAVVDVDVTEFDSISAVHAVSFLLNRCRRMIAVAFIDNNMKSRTMIAAAAIERNSGCGRAVQL